MNAAVKFTKQQITDWKAYERVRSSGTWNMYFPSARAATGLSSERYIFVMDNYLQLKEAAEKEGK